MKEVREMAKRTVFTIGIGFFLVIILAPGVFAQEKPFTAGIRIGAFIPQNWQIQGYGAVYYNSDGSPTGVNFSGFGNGIDFSLHCSYYFSNWGLMLETGGRTLLKRKIDIDIAPDGRNQFYENRLIIFPITLSLIHKISVPDSKVTPVLGTGFGVYISEWEQKHYYENVGGTLVQEYLKGSSIPIGIHCLIGCYYPLYDNLLFDCECRYSYAESDWKIKDDERNTETKFIGLNTGGVSLRLGLSFRF